MRIIRRLAVTAASFALAGGGLGLALAPAAQATQPATVHAAAVTPQIWAYGCDYATSTPVISYGSTGSAVKQAQCLLNAWGEASLTVDGIFGTDTLNAVETFQRTWCGLTVDGIVGPNTWYALEHADCA